MVKNGTTRMQKKTSLPEIQDSDDVSRMMLRPRRAAAGTDFKEKSYRSYKKSDTMKTKKQQINVEDDEFVAFQLTSVPSNPMCNIRRLTDFVLHDSYGVPQPVEMLEISNIFISGVILLSEECSDDKVKRKSLRCESFGRIKEWSISGIEDGSPVIWVSTKLAHYSCLNPNPRYKKIYDYFSQKAFTTVSVYKTLSTNPDTSLEKLLAAVVGSMNGSNYFSSDLAIEEFIIYLGEFIYEQLTGLDKTAKKHEARFADIPVLLSLKDESIDKAKQMERRFSDGVSEVGESEDLTTTDEDRRYAKLFQDEEYRKTLEHHKNIIEDEIANDALSSKEETCELLLSNAGYEVDTIDLPPRTLHNWDLCISDLGLISLEFLPKKQCGDMDVTFFGSGVVTDVDSSMENDLDGMKNISLSQIKEWMIEFVEGGGLISISLRTNMAWYQLGKPSKQLYEPFLKTASVGIRMSTWHVEQRRVAKLSLDYNMKRLVALEENNDEAYLSSDSDAVERYLVVNEPLILQPLVAYPKEEIIEFSPVTCLASKMKKWSPARFYYSMKKRSPAIYSMKKRILQRGVKRIQNLYQCQQQKLA